MAIDIIPLNKPDIVLAGYRVTTSGVREWEMLHYEHATKSYTYATNVVESPTLLNANDIPTFRDPVRVIITPNTGPKPTYMRSLRELGPLEFEGNAMFDTGGRETPGRLRRVAETYYTINGTDPIRHKLHLYNYLDMNDFNANPSAGGATADNLETIGFPIGASQTGSDLITLQVRCFADGLVSPLAKVVFKIARNEPNTIYNQSQP